jgi:uncharacterized protein (TIGR02996 family)
MDTNPLLAAILADPDDAPLRLVYSDWLEENADSGNFRIEQAELIRLQLELERLWPGYPGEPRSSDWAPDPRARELGLRARELAKPFAPSRKWSLRDWAIRRGVLDDLAFSLAVLDRAGPLCRAHPIRHLRLTRGRGRGAQLAEFEPLARVRSLELGTMEPADLVALARCPHLAGLRGLGLHGQRLHEVLPLLASSHLQPVTALTLGPDVLPGRPGPKPGLRLFLDNAHNNIDTAGVANLLSAPALKSLQELRILRGNLGDEVVHTLARTPLSGLTRLELSNYPPITHRGVRALLVLPFLAGLKTLCLDGAEVGDEGARVLAFAPHLAGLRVVSLRQAGIGDEGGRALADSPYLQHIERLELLWNNLSSDVRVRLHQRFGLRACTDSRR